MDKPNDTKPNEPAAKEEKTEKPAPTDKQPATTKEPDKKEESFTKADLDAAVAAALKESQKEADKAKEREQLSKEERLALELEDAKRENAMMKAESEVVMALTAAGAKSPKLLFEAKQSALEFKDGKLTNLTEVVESLKKSYPDQFGEDKPNESIDAGKGQKNDKERAETLGGALKAYYKK